jgi:hypothetical protein
MAALLRWFETPPDRSLLAGLHPKRVLDSFDSQESPSSAVRDEPVHDRPRKHHTPDLAAGVVQVPSDKD